MATDYFNQALKLINKKPTITEMTQNGYFAYVYPQPTIDYACKILNARELKLYLQICGQANGFNGAMKFYSVKANIKSNHYSEIMDSLEKKGFIKHIKYESIEVLFPTEETDKKESAENQKGNQKGNIIKSMDDSQSSKNAENKGITEMGKIEENFGKTQDNFGKNDSQSYVYNRETNINIKNLHREERESLLEEERQEIEKEEQKEEIFRNKALIIVKQIGKKFNIMEKVLNQFKDLQERFTNQYIYFGLKYKSIDSFSMGIGLLFTENYHYEIQQIIMATEELQESNYEIDFLKDSEEEKENLTIEDLI